MFEPNFWDIVVVQDNLIWVCVKCWKVNETFHYEVYNRMCNWIESYKESKIERYKVRHKYLNDEELEYQNMD